MMLRWKSLAALLLASGCQMLHGAEAVLVPTPRASELATTATSRPFLAATRAQQAVDLATRGYVETEHAVRGQHAGQGFITRILVRRPLDARRFSGRVILEPLNAFVSHESAPLWGFSWEHFLRRGDAWVGVTVSGRAVETLKRFNATRYTALNLGTAQTPTCTAGQLPSLQADVIAQAGALLRSSSKENPLLGLNPQRLVAGGYAGAADAITAFAGGSHRQLRLGDAAPVFDGYLVASTAPASAADGCGPVAVGPLEAPTDAAFVRLSTEPDAAIGGAAHSGNEAPAFRHYGIAGSLRARPSAAGMAGSADVAAARVALPVESGCREPLMDRTLSYAMNGVWQQLDDWMVLDQPLASLPQMTAADGSTAGGWRLPQVDLPLSRFASASQPVTAQAGAGRPQAPCDALWGTTPRLDAAMLKSLYRDRNEYMRRFNAALDQALVERLLVKEDAAALKALVTRMLPVF